MSDTSLLAPNAVDLLLVEEAKQQRLLLKLREKAQVEKTLAELELLQMQKRILRAQGEKEKAATIKKKQRGLLIKLQEERAKIDSLRKSHKRNVVSRKVETSANAAYDSSSWETDCSGSSSTQSACSNNNVRGAGDPQPDSHSPIERATSQTVSEAIEVSLMIIMAIVEFNNYCFSSFYL